MDDDTRFWLMVGGAALTGGLLWLLAFRHFPTEVGWITFGCAVIAASYSFWTLGQERNVPKVLELIFFCSFAVFVSFLAGGLMKELSKLVF